MGNIGTCNCEEINYFVRCPRCGKMMETLFTYSDNKIASEKTSCGNCGLVPKTKGRPFEWEAIKRKIDRMINAKCCYVCENDNKEECLSCQQLLVEGVDHKFWR